MMLLSMERRTSNQDRVTQMKLIATERQPVDQTDRGKGREERANERRGEEGREMDVYRRKLFCDNITKPVSTSSETVREIDLAGIIYLDSIPPNRWTRIEPIRYEWLGS